VRAALFCLVFVGFSLWEARHCRDPQSGSMPRWWCNVGLYALNLALFAAVSLVFAFGGAGEMPTGALAAALVFIAGFLLLDLAVYAAHRIYHAVPWLWPFHAVHHSDRVLDASTAIRHHPGEYLLTASMIVGLAWLVGLPAAVIATYGTVAISVQIAQHANVRLPAALEDRLEGIIMVPVAHRMHHDLDVRMANSNFGVVLSVWDRLFGTYLPPLPSHEALRYGVDGVPEATAGSFAGVLALPMTIARQAIASGTSRG
jgi:sterol desaturase/sphingolipid hydroxylase (fatty acid hydroxylase superfamily)